MRTALVLLSLAACGAASRPARRCDDPAKALRTVGEADAYTLASYQRALADAGITLVDAEVAVNGDARRDAGVPFLLDGKQVVATFSIAAPDNRQLGRLADGSLVLVEPVRHVESQVGFTLCGCEPGASGGGGAHAPPSEGQTVYRLPEGFRWSGTRRVVYQAREALAPYDHIQADGRQCPIPD